MFDIIMTYYIATYGICVNDNYIRLYKNNYITIPITIKHKIIYTIYIYIYVYKYY